MHALGEGGRDPGIIQPGRGDDRGARTHGLIGGSPRARVDAAARRRRERNRRRASVSFTASERRRARGTESTTYRVTHALSRSISRRVRVVGHERLTAVDARGRRRAEHRLLKIARRRLRLKHGASAVRVGRFKPRLFDDVRDGDETTAATLESSRASQRAARARAPPSVNRTPRAARRDAMSLVPRPKEGEAPIRARRRLRRRRLRRLRLRRHVARWKVTRWSPKFGVLLQCERRARNNPKENNKEKQIPPADRWRGVKKYAVS